MLPYIRDDKPPVRLLTAQGQLPGYIDPTQLPTKRKPFTSIWAQKHSHTLNVLLPAELLEVVQKHLDDIAGDSMYAKVNMSLLELLSGDFFSEYIKNGDVGMRSEGMRGSDEVFELHQGTLTLEIDRPTYERAGLQGRPIPDGGKKHTQSRFLIEHDLRAPASVPGKKGFERLLSAARDVLNERKTWLFYDHGAAATDAGQNGPIKAFAPRWITLKPTITRMERVRVPAWSKTSLAEDQEFAADVHEWLALVVLGSPRVRAGDDIDPYLCRHSLPVPDVRASGQERTAALVHMRLRGFLPAAFVLRVLAAIKRAIMHAHKASEVAMDNDGDGHRAWAALMAHGFCDEHTTTMLPDEDNFVEMVHRKRL